MTIDAARIDRVVTFIRDHDTSSVVAELLPGFSDAEQRALAVLYGGPFYESFGALDHAVRWQR